MNAVAPGTLTEKASLLDDSFPPGGSVVDGQLIIGQNIPACDESYGRPFKLSMAAVKLNRQQVLKTRVVKEPRDIAVAARIHIMFAFNLNENY